MIGARALRPAGCVYAFELSPSLAAPVRDDAARNSFENVHVFKTAISAIDGKICFGIHGPLSLLTSVRADQAAETATVESIRLDTFCTDHCPPGLMPIDIEGSEIEALDGSGLQMTTHHWPVLMVEVHWFGQGL